MNSINFENDSFGGHFDFVPTLENFDYSDVSQVPVFDFEEDTESVISGLCSTSKKICKIPSEKRSKRGRNPWTNKEDAKLSELMIKYGQSWAMISSFLPGRTGKQVRDRFLNKLRPNIKLGDWSQAEDDLLVRLCREVGNRWSLIANHLPGRTEGQVKNRFYSYIKKRLQPDGTLSQTGSVSDSSRNMSEASGSFVNSPVNEQTFDFRQDFDFSLADTCPMTFVNMGYTTIPMNSYMVTKGPFIATQEIAYEQNTTNNTSVASFSPVRMAPSDPADLISYDMPVSTFCRQISQMPVAQPNFYENQESFSAQSSVDSFFSQEAVPTIPAFPSVEAENERLRKLNQRKALLELALAETLNEIQGC